MVRARLTDQERLLRQVKESAWTRQVIQLARTLGWRVHHSRPAINQRGRWLTPLAGAAGLPDLVLVKPPRVVFAELKRQHGYELSEGQRAWLEDLSRCPGVESYVWKPGDVREVATLLGGNL